MKIQIEESNCQSLLGKLTKGSMQERSVSLRKLLSIYQGGRSKIYLYQRRITQCLQLSLLIQQKDISLNALTLLQKIIINTTPDSQIIPIVKRRLLSKVVLNLGSVNLTIRKQSHKCLLQYLRKVRQFQSITINYLRTALQQNQNAHLKLKAINSLHSLLMAQYKYYDHQLQSSRSLFEQIVIMAYQNDQLDLKRAALVCLIFLMEISGIKTVLPLFNATIHQYLNQLRNQSPDLDQIFRELMREQSMREQSSQTIQQRDVPSPKFINIQQIDKNHNISQQSILQQKQQLRRTQNESKSIQKNIRISQGALKIYGDVTQAQQMLRRMQQTGGGWQVSEIQNMAPFIQRCLTDQSIKLFSISKKIVQVILSSQDGARKQYYVIIVPCVVSGITNKRFIVRKNLDKLARTYSKNHPAIWVQNFVQKIAVSKNHKLKQSLLDLLSYAYKSSPQFYLSTKRLFQVFDQEYCDPASPLKRKILQVIILILQRNHIGNQQIIQNLSPQFQHIIIRKLGKNQIASIEPLTIQPNSPIHQIMGGNNININTLLPSLQPSSPVPFSKNRKQRLITAEPQRTAQQKHESNFSEQKKISREAIRSRKSHIDIFVARIRKSERKSEDSRQRTSLQKLPQLKKARNNSNNKYENADSPVKRSIAQRSLIYPDKQHLPILPNPKEDLERIMIQLKDTNWSVQFQAIGLLRSAIEHHRQQLGDQAILQSASLLLHVFGGLRSGAGKLALICLGELMRKIHRKVYPLSEVITQTLIKKSITTSDYLQQQVKRCVGIAIQQLCPSKIILALESAKQSKSLDVKMTLLLFVQGMIVFQKLYKKQMGWIWKTISDYSEDAQSVLRNQSRRLVKLAIQNIKDWKQQVLSQPEQIREKLQRLIKCLPKDNIETQQFQKILNMKNINSKYFMNAYAKFQEQDRNLTYKKNWKQRINLLLHNFSLIHQQPAQFLQNINAKKYLIVAYQHIDQKNPGLLLNSLTILSRSIQLFPILFQETLPILMQKLCSVLQTKRGQLIAAANKLLNKIHVKIDINKVLKQYFKIIMIKPKTQLINHLITLLRQGQNRSMRQIPAQCNRQILQTPPNNISNIALKAIVRLTAQKTEGGQWTGKLRDLVLACQRRFGSQFSNKAMSSNRVLQLMS